MPSIKSNKPCIPCESKRVEINTRREGEFKVLEDGSLLFKKLPEFRPGYTHDPSNKYKLVPTHLPCTKRITVPKLERTGVYTITNTCNHPNHAVRGQEVTPEDCKACPMRVIIPVLNKSRERV